MKAAECTWYKSIRKETFTDLRTVSYPFNKTPDEPLLIEQLLDEQLAVAQSQSESQHSIVISICDAESMEWLE